MLLFRQSLDSQKSQVLPDDKYRSIFNPDEVIEEEKESEKLTFDPDYDIFIQKIDNGGCYDNLFRLKRFQSVLKQNKSSVIGMSVLNPMRNEKNSTTLLVTLHEDKLVRVWDLYETSFLKEIECYPGNEEKPARIVRSHIPSNKIAPEPDREPVKVPDFKLTALTTYTPSTKHAEIGRKVIIGGGNDNSSFVIIYDEDAEQSDLLFPFSSANHSRAINCIVVVEAKLNRHGETESPIVVVASADKSFSVWDLKTRKLIFKTITKHTDMLLSITVLDWRKGNEGLLFITGGWDKNIFSYEWNNDSYIHNYKGHKKSVTIVYAHYLRGNSAMKNVECGVLITGSLDKTVIVWDVETKEQVRILTGHDGKITGLSIFEREEGSPPVIITCSEDSKTILWDLLSGEKMRELYLPEKVLCQSIMTNHYGMILLSGCALGKAVVTNLCRTERIRKYFTRAVTAIATYTPRKDDPSFWKDEPTVLIGDINNSCSLYKLHSHKKIANVCVHHTSRINAAIIYTPPPNSTGPVNASEPKVPLFKRLSENVDNYRAYNPLVISCDGKAVISVWDLFESSRLVKTLKEHNGTVMTIALYEPHKCGKSMSMSPVEPVDDTPLSSSNNANPSTAAPVVDLSQPILISGGSDANLKFWYLLDESNKSFHTIPNAHKGMIRSISMYHPTEGNPITDPFFVTGGYDRSVAIYNLRTLSFLYRVNAMHTDYVFFIGLYDPFAHLGKGNHKKQEIRDELLNHPVLVTSSYDKTLKVSALMNLDFNQQEAIIEDGSSSVHDSSKSPIRPKSGLASHRRGSRSNGLTTSVTHEEIHHLTDCHRDSVTAMTIYTPPNPDEIPLILSGSIDRMIIVWNLYTGEPLQKLIGHTDRVCYLTTYLPESGKNPLVFSGSDDETTIAWEDTLYPHSFMPLRDDVNRNFTSDCLEEDWPLITELANKYKSALFLVNANLFYLAIKYNRPDFIVKFQKYLSITLPLMHDYNGINLLTYAVNSNDLLSVRTILSCWVENLNKDIHDVLTQRMYHASYFFPDKDLPLLAKKYPVEFKNFITSLRLVKNHTVLLLNDFETPAGNAFQQLHFDHHGKHVKDYGITGSGKRNSLGPNSGGSNGKLEKKGLSSSTLQQEQKVIAELDENGIHYDLLEAFESETLHAMNNTRVLRLHPIERYEVEATSNSIPKFNELWIKKFITTTYYDYFLSVWNEFVYELPDPQPITSLMVPLRNTATKEMIEYFVTVSNQLDNEEIFNSEVGYVSLRYFWDSKAKFYHLSAFAFHLLVLLLYNVALYTFEFYYLKHKFNHGERIACYILNIIVLLFFVYYLYEEIAQFLYEHQLKIRRESKMFYYSSKNLLAKKTMLDHIRDQTTGFSIYQEDEPEIGDEYSVTVGGAGGNHSPTAAGGRHSLLRTKPSPKIHKLRSHNGKKVTIATLIRYFLEHFLLDLWNLVDISITFTAGTGMVMRLIFVDDVPTGRAFLAIGSVLLWFKVLYFLRPFSNSGPLVTMIIQISYKLSSIRVFLFVLFCVLCGFTQAFWVLSNEHPEDTSLLWSTIKGGFLTSFTYMLGQNVDAHSVYNTVSPTLGVILLVLFMLIMMLMMLNLLIALMGDAFAEVRAKGFGVWRKEQASIILEESFFFAKDTNRIPPYLHVLMYTSEVDVERKEAEENNGKEKEKEGGTSSSGSSKECDHKESLGSPKKDKKV